MKTSPDERSYTGMLKRWYFLLKVVGTALFLPLPEFHLNSDSKYSSTDIHPKCPIITETQHHGTPTSRILQNTNKHYQQRRDSDVSSHHNAPNYWDGQKQHHQNL
jgi:hypothetical protein